MIPGLYDSFALPISSLEIYSSRCSMCHDSSGQKLSDKTERYQTAKGLLDYVKTAMPPGSPVIYRHSNILR